MGNNNDSVLEMYLYETNSLLEQLDNIVLRAEQADTLSADEVNEIFRIMHTLKGSAAMMEYQSLMTIAHRIEDLFFIIREKSMDAIPEKDRPALFDMLFHSIDFFRSEVDKIEKGETLSNNIDSFVDQINRFIDKIQKDQQEEPSNQGNSEEKEASVPMAGDAERPFALRVFLEGGMENLRAFMLIKDIQECCSDFTSDPEHPETDESLSPAIAENGMILYFRDDAARKSAISVASGLSFVRSYETMDCTVAPAAEEKPAETQNVTPTESNVEKAPAAMVETEKHHPAPTPDAGQQPGHQIKQSLISVNLSKLDQLAAVVGEIVIYEAMVTASPDLKGLDRNKLDNFNKSARQLRKLTDELQDISMSLRMVPVSGTFQKMRRIVRDMGSKLGKKARLTIIGEDTEIDKTIVDAISDPIMHIVRNSMDHGIEANVQDRIDAGKDPEGEIILSAQNTGSDVIITIEDDGAGVDTDAVLAKAIRQGLVSNPEAELSQKEILDFLMMPGFSTNTEVTEFSGRGVGMDVVKKNIESVGGVVTMTTEQGRGSCTTLKIPLTTAILDGMEVSVGDSIFTIPLLDIRQSFKITDEEIIHDAMRGEMVQRMDNFYPIIRLNEFYGLEPKAQTMEDGILVWVETNELSYCLFVDELLGEQQVVLKPIPAYLNKFGIKNAGIVGCTILGDGNISLILEIGNLFKASQGGY